MNSTVKEAIEWGICVIIAIILALTIRFYIGTPTVVESLSMYPTLKEGERLILNRMIRTFGGKYERGDIVTFEAPKILQVTSFNGETDKGIATFYEPQGIFAKFVYYVLEIGKKSYIKRVIGLPRRAC